MTVANPDRGQSEAITLGLHDVSPQDMVDVMADDVALEMGWGRLLFGQTFADPAKLAEVLRQESLGRRDICMYAREPHVLVSMAPAELFIDPSHTYRLRFSDDDGPGPSPTGFRRRRCSSPPASPSTAAPRWPSDCSRSFRPLRSPGGGWRSRRSCCSPGGDRGDSRGPGGNWPQPACSAPCSPP